MSCPQSSRRSAAFKRRWPLGFARLSLAASAVMCVTIPHAVAVSGAVGPAVVIPIEGGITDITARSIERRVEQALQDGAKTIIFELNTPGGMVTSALDICRTIKTLPDDVHSVAWVNPYAYSAGAMISVACKQIVMGASSRIGDCAPIMVTPTGGLQPLGDAERAKAESPVLQEFRDSADLNGYDRLLCRAMVTVGQEVWWIENVETKERKFVAPAEKKKLLGRSGWDQSAWRLVTEYVNPKTGQAVPARQPIDPENELLTLSQAEAAAYGFASGIVADLGELQALLGLNTAPAYIKVSGWEKFAAWLNSPLIRGILMMVVVIGAYTEFQKPGLIIPGSAAAVALIIFFAAPYAAGLASIWHILLLALGAALVLAEIFIIPGFGIAGLLGGAIILVALVATFVPAEPQAPTFSLPSMQVTWDAIMEGIKVMALSLLASLVGIAAIIRYLPQMRLSRKVLLASPQRAALAVDDPHPNVALQGDVGVVTGALRPGGQARFGSEIVDVESQGEYVEGGVRVTVVQRAGRRIVVRPLRDEA